MPYLHEVGVEIWSRKVARYAERSFGPSVSRWSLCALVVLCRRQTNIMRAASLLDLSDELGVPLKYLPRVLAVLTRSGLVEIDWNDIRLTFRRERLKRSKNPAQKRRKQPSRAERRHLFRMDGYRCGHCGKQFKADELQLDHIVPLSLLGADEPGNWVSLCRKHTRLKWHEFIPDYLKYYRGRRVGSMGVRFANGAFWPHINRRTRDETRDTWLFRFSRWRVSSDERRD